jgi:hypothetical protein
MLVLNGEMLGRIRFYTSSSNCGAIGINTKITILQVVGLAQGKRRQVSTTSLNSQFWLWEAYCCILGWIRRAQNGYS